MSDWIDSILIVHDVQYSTVFLRRTVAYFNYLNLLFSFLSIWHYLHCVSNNCLLFCLNPIFIMFGMQYPDNPRRKPSGHFWDTWWCCWKLLYVCWLIVLQQSDRPSPSHWLLTTRSVSVNVRLLIDRLVCC